MRLIDADALVKALNESGVPYRADVQEVLDAQPTVDAVPRWIPCEERLPEPTQEVLVTGINGCVYTSRIVHGEFEYGGNVIAWMPLPLPYKGERKDNE